MAYSETYFTARESWRDWRIEAQMLIARARVSPGARVLEIGCGGGGLLRMARARGACVFGVDTLGSALNLAQAQDAAKSPAPRPARSALVRIGEDGALPFGDHAFDAILGQHVVEHVPDAEAALREWRRVLKPGGRLVLATPNAHYPDPAHFADADHAHVFAPAELGAAITHAGLIVENWITLFPFLSRVRGLRTLGVVAYRLFLSAPYFATHGRTIIVSARKP